jgi:hypothetical protein
MVYAPSGGVTEVEDVVQDAWFQLGRTDRSEIGRVAVRPVVPISPFAPETPRSARLRATVTTRMVHESFRNQNG